MVLCETKSVNNTLPWDAIFAGVIIDRCDRDRRCGSLHLFKENSERDCFDEMMEGNTRVMVLPRERAKLHREVRSQCSQTRETH